MNDRRIQLIDPARFWSANVWDDYMKDLLPNATGELEMYEDENNIVVKMKAAGFTPEQIEISIEGKMLTITGKSEAEKEDQDLKRKYYYREMRNESFTRSVSLPNNVKSDSVNAGFKNGILTITMPKVEEVKPKKIAITVN